MQLKSCVSAQLPYLAQVIVKDEKDRLFLVLCSKETGGGLLLQVETLHSVHAHEVGIKYDQSFSIEKCCRKTNIRNLIGMMLLTAHNELEPEQMRERGGLFGSNSWLLCSRAQ